MSWRMAYRNRRVLVLGARGFIGRWVVQRLREGGADLHLAVRDAGGAAGEDGVNAALHEVDLARPGAAGELVGAVRPALTFNLAGYGVDPGEADPHLAWRVNSDLVAELARACATRFDPSWQGQQLVHVGSAAEYGSAGGDLAEDAAPSPTTLYGRSKLGGTGDLLAASRSGALRGVTARLFTVYGPGERSGRLLPVLLAAARAGSEVSLTEGTQRRDFTYVEDVAEGLLRLGVVRQDRLGTVNLATGKLESVRRFAERAAAVLKLPAERLRFGVLPTRPDEMQHDPVSLQRLSSLCGWIPETSIEAGVRRTADLSEQRA